MEDDIGVVQECDPSCSSAQNLDGGVGEAMEVAGRRKRRRGRSIKNREEVESQRMTHIAVERNRRRQMNEYLAVLRSLMPSFYVQRGDQASIVAGAINYVKELEQLLRSLEVQKRLERRTDAAGVASAFAGFFSFPQISSFFPNGGGGNCNDDNSSISHSGAFTRNTDEIENQTAAANIEVTMLESHANLKVLSRRRPRQLLRLVAGLQSLRLVPLHLNVTSVDRIVMYSFSLKVYRALRPRSTSLRFPTSSEPALFGFDRQVEDDCRCPSADEIAGAVHRMLIRIEEEANL
ncbi:Helix-loop-helix DNA-binding domain [Musa troglodytarum]|uniref:Helix-loop-helix DNA-binding domain n=1 Tax=Musa troglodytarum TaxID=320322 RepID=A0A9E7EZH5_9LILI|nr:Helix-loop-helix DNA-binding domain [Musa troglodytarum]